MQRNILKFQPDSPVLVTLDYGPEGKQHTNTRGEIDFQYTVNGNQDIFWLPPAGRDALLRSGAQKGDQVEITRVLRGHVESFSARLVGRSQPANGNAYRADNGPQPVNGNGNGHYNGNGGNGQPVQPPQKAPEPPPNNTADYISGYLCAAVDASIRMQKYAQQHYSLALAVDAEFVRRLAISMIIDTREACK